MLQNVGNEHIKKRGAVMFKHLFGLKMIRIVQRFSHKLSDTFLDRSKKTISIVCITTSHTYFNGQNAQVRVYR